MKHREITALAAWMAVATGTLWAQGGLLISELLFQPASGEAEYVELYNPTATAVQLDGYHIVRVLHDTLATHYALPPHSVAPHEYVVLTTDAASVGACFHVEYPQRVVECRLPTYPNSGGSVVLCTADSQLVERFDYSPAMHSRLLRDKAGVSLERRSFDRPANEAVNWFSAASTAGHGTPTATNSQSSEWLVEETRFDFSAATVSPDGDGYQDELVVSYQLDSPDLSARAEVYDARGNMVRRLLNGDLLGTGGSLHWDGRAEDGSELPMGQYLLQITLYDLGGTQQTVRRAVAVVR